jgi:hypothetical protein
MKPLQYVQKYNLNTNSNFNHSEFIQDLTTDFLTLLEISKTSTGKYVLAGFENTVRAIRQKWDGISNKTIGVGLPDKLWNYFYATVIVKMRQELFPDEMKRRQQEKEDYKRQKEQRKQAWENDFGGYFFNMFDFLFKNINRIPSDSFATLSLSDNATEDDVKSKYRELSKLHHPDMGGNSAKFMEITEAKNKCLIFFKNKVTV